MRCWPARTSRLPATLVCVAALGLGAGCSSGAPGTGLAIEEARWSVGDGAVNLALELEIGLTAAVAEALHNGVPITVLIETRVLEPRRWFWDRTLIEDERRYTLSHQSLSDQYLVRAPGSETFRAYPSREIALSVMETPDDWRGALPEGTEAGDLRARVRARLELQSLPAPLRLTAYFSPDWRIGSGWHSERLDAAGAEAP